MKRYARNAFFLALGHAVSKGAMLALWLAVPRWLGAAALGHLTLGMGLATFLRSFLDFGLQKVSTRHVSRNPREAGRFLAEAVRSKRILLAAGLPAFAAAAAYYALRPQGAEGMGLFLACLGLSVALEVVVLARGYVFNGLERMDLDTVSVALRQGGGVAVGLAGIWLGWGLPAVGLGILLGQAGSLLLTGGLLRGLGLAGQRATAEGARRTLAEGLPIALGGVFGLVYSKGNAFLIDHFLGPEQTGLYSASCTVMLESQVIPAVLSAAAFPIFARLGMREAGEGGTGRPDARGLLRRAAWVAGALLAVCLPLAAVLSWKAEWFLDLLYGKPEFAATAPIFALLAWMIPITCLNVLLGDLIYALDGDRLALRIAATVALSSLAANLIAIPRWGLTGAAWVNLGAEGLFFALDLAVLARLLRRGR